MKRLLELLRGTGVDVEYCGKFGEPDPNIEAAILSGILEEDTIDPSYDVYILLNNLPGVGLMHVHVPRLDVGFFGFKDIPEGKTVLNNGMIRSYVEFINYIAASLKELNDQRNAQHTPPYTNIEYILRPVNPEQRTWQPFVRLIPPDCDQ